MTPRELFDRYGIAAIVLVALAASVLVFPSNTTGRVTGAQDVGAGSDLDGFEAGGFSADGFPIEEAGSGGSTPAGGAGPAVSTGGGRRNTPGGGTTPGTGTTPGPTHTSAGDVAWGEGPCRPDGRQSGIARYMPPCVRWAGKAKGNGGSTYRGVTGDQVLIVRYLAQLNPGTRAILQGANLADEPATIARSYRQLFRYQNLHVETYGRTVVFQDFSASGPSTSDEHMRNDAEKIANQIKPFAVIEGDPSAPVPIVLARELAKRNVLCMCSTSLSQAFYAEQPPVVFSSLPTIDEYAAHTAEYIAKKLAGKPAAFAGDELNPGQGYRQKTRVFGLIAQNGTEGAIEEERLRIRDVMKAALAARGIDLGDRVVEYNYQPGAGQDEVTNLVNQLKSKGVTTVIPIWDPLYPILITQEATRQNWFPEWFIVGTGLSDTTAAGRLYDQFQWRHAFGISPLWVTWQTVQGSAGYREYHHVTNEACSERADEPCAGVLVNIYRSRIQTLFRGIHMAGPNLTNETFIAGQFAFPPTGGLPAAPLVYLTRQSPTEIKDFVEVWYDFDRSGPDERSENGQGMVMKAAGGKRYQAGQWTSDPSLAFVDDGTIAVSDSLEGDVEHEGDGHTHPADQRCLSCS